MSPNLSKIPWGEMVVNLGLDSNPSLNKAWLIKALEISFPLVKPLSTDWYPQPMSTTKVETSQNFSTQKEYFLFWSFR